MNTILLWLPSIFADDHYTRRDGIPTGVKLKRQGKRVQFEISDRSTFNDWLADADYYRDPTGFDHEMIPLCRSAARAYSTLREARAQACEVFGHGWIVKDGETICRHCNEPLAVTGNELYQTNRTAYCREVADVPPMQALRLYRSMSGRIALQVRSAGPINESQKGKPRNMIAGVNLDVSKAIELRDALDEWIKGEV